MTREPKRGDHDYVWDIAIEHRPKMKKGGVMAFEEYEVRGYKVKSFKTREEFQAAIQNWIEGKDLDDSDFEDLWAQVSEGKRNSYLKAAENAFPAEVVKRPEGVTRAEHADRMEADEESRQARVQKEARKSFAATLPFTKLEKFESLAQATVDAQNKAEVAGRKERIEADKEKKAQEREARAQQRKQEGFGGDGWTI